MEHIINASIRTLHKSIALLDHLNDEQLSDTNIPPYYSCIGSHVRHILDFYECILEGSRMTLGPIDLTNRKRDERMHNDCCYASEQAQRIINGLEALKGKNYAPEALITVTDDLGLGKMAIEYTLGAVMAQANSHAIHHYAIINYMLDRQGICVKDAEFGYNPTTPRGAEATG